MREAKRCRATIAVLGVLAFAASCGSGTADEDDAATAGQPAPSDGGITAGLTSAVVAGDNAGWVVDQDRSVWRIGLDGEATQTEVEVPVYNQGFSTFFDGVVVIGGTRCDGTVRGEDCDGESVVEMRLIRETDATVEVVELRREDHGYRSIGAGVLGVAGDEAWIYGDTGELSAVNAEGTVTELAIPAGADTGHSHCMVDDDLYGLRDTLAATENSGGVTAATIYEPGGQSAHSWVVDRWNGTAWVPLDNGAYTIDGSDVSLTCTAEGYVIHSYGTPQTPLLDWTPDLGWRRPAPPVADLDVNSLLTATTNTLYTVTDGIVQRVDVASHQLAATGITEASLTNQATGAEVDIVDDAGSLLIACHSHGESAACTVTSDE